MYQKFEVNNFRCFKELALSNLKQVNLITGVNNVGKTSLLEALFLHAGATNPGLTLNINAFRGIEGVKIEFGRWFETPWSSLFNQFDISKNIRLVGENETNSRRTLQFKIIHKPEDLVKIRQSIEPALGPETRSMWSEPGAQVLELLHWDGKVEHNYYMVLTLQGLRVVPVPPPPPFPGIFLAARIRIRPTEDAERFGTMDIRGQQDVLLKALQVIEPRLKRLAVVATGPGGPMLHGEVGLNQLIPLPLLGEGMARLASLVLAVGNAPDGVVLIDEIENGLHHSIMPKVWKVIGEVARKFNAQVFATTHSLECILSAHKAFSESGRYDFGLHRLEFVKDAIMAIAYDKETLAAAIEADLEVR